MHPPPYAFLDVAHPPGACLSMLSPFLRAALAARRSESHVRQRLPDLAPGGLVTYGAAACDVRTCRWPRSDEGPSHLPVAVSTMRPIPARMLLREGSAYTPAVPGRQQTSADPVPLHPLPLHPYLQRVLLTPGAVLPAGAAAREPRRSLPPPCDACQRSKIPRVRLPSTVPSGARAGSTEPRARIHHNAAQRGSQPVGQQIQDVRVPERHKSLVNLVYRAVHSRQNTRHPCRAA